MFIEASRLRDLYECDFENGTLRNRIAKPHSPAGKVVGNLRRDGYLATTVKGKFAMVHRIIWAMYYGEWPAHDLDHIDGDRLNNSISNLRKANDSQNQANRRKHRGVSRYKGVTWHNGSRKWQAQIGKGGKNYFLGLFQTEEDAHAAYLSKAKELFGEYARAA